MSDTQTTPAPTTEVTDLGWAFPTTTARKCHYFRSERRSLCGRYALYFVPDGHFLAPDSGRAGPDDCTPCRRELDKQGVQ